ncbi:hypothetical protein Tco_0973740 [Tanacetum coccineum]|uniref:Uncharacterized protein n=1 Tax=Tanacetum coccineum TaxID=301880 RepID=A0ABQ5E9L1_9ASTR
MQLIQNQSKESLHDLGDFHGTNVLVHGINYKSKLDNENSRDWIQRTLDNEQPEFNNEEKTSHTTTRDVVENVSSGHPSSKGQKASDYDNSDPVPPRQNVVPSAEKTDSSQTKGLEFL